MNNDDLFDGLTEEELSLENILAEFKSGKFSSEPISDVPEKPPVAEEDVKIYSGTPASPVTEAAVSSEDEDAGDEQEESAPEADKLDGDAYIIQGTPEEKEECASGDIDYEDAAQQLQNELSETPEEKSKSSSFKEKIGAPVLAFIAMIVSKVQQSSRNLSSAPAEEAEDLGPEMPPDKACKFYEKHLPAMRLRTKISFIVSLVLLYISVGLPVFGALNSCNVCSAVSMMLLATVMLLGLDVITHGIICLVKLRFHADCLVALSCIFSLIDALVIAIAGGQYLPYCAVSALTVSFTLLGCVLNARCNRIVFRSAAAARRPYTLTAEDGVAEDGITLLKSTMPTDGFVRRTEESTPDENIFGFLAPFLIAAVLLFGIIAAAIGKSFPEIAHIYSAMLVSCTPIVILFCYPLPFFVSAKQLLRTGSCIAGWSGLYDIGKSKHIIITDRDLFSRKNVSIDKVRILSGMQPDKVISYAGSIMAASGCAMAPAFTELMSKGNGSLMRVDEFRCHESGGLIAMINGEDIYCGSSGFMQLMGIRLPPKLALKNCVFIAASGVLNGIFEIKYTATQASKDALISLMRSNRHPIFAVRDFNMTPQMLSRKFDVPTDGFDFPAFTRRYSISAAEPSGSSKPAALIAKEGIAPLVKLADHGKRLYNVIRICILICVMSAVIGLITAFIHCCAADFAAISVGKILLHMLLWFIPEIALIFSLRVN